MRNLGNRTHEIPNCKRVDPSSFLQIKQETRRENTKQAWPPLLIPATGLVGANLWVEPDLPAYHPPALSACSEPRSLRGEPLLLSLL